MTPKLFTSRYQNQDAIVNSGLVPVRTSRGYPRFPLHYKPISLPGLYPDRELMKIEDPGRFADLYIAQVEAAWSQVEREIKIISEENNGAGLVLLCYEDLSKAWCHRRIFAGWMGDKFGVTVAEL